MAVIELPDDQVAALAAKAAAQGMLLKDWLGKLASGEGAERAQAAQLRDESPIWDVIQDIMKDVPDDVLDRLPKDGASQVDHYIYGLPKRD